MENVRAFLGRGKRLRHSLLGGVHCPRSGSRHSGAWKQKVAVVVAHELAHQWFGNLVTMEWWTHLWLNEGFATWVSYLAADNFFPEWNVWTQFLEESTTGFKLDALAGSHPIEVDVNHVDEIDEIFDAISYRKGAAVIRMLQSYLGAEVFQKSLAAYIKKFAYSNAKTEDLWAALEEGSGEPVRTLMHSWTKQQGYPVVSVKHKDGKLQLEQELLKKGVAWRVGDGKSIKILSDNWIPNVQAGLICAPGKMKINLCRAAHDCLPTGFQLQRRHIEARDGCAFCSRDDRIEHVFLMCPFSDSVWKEIKQVYNIKLGRGDLANVRQWIFDFLRRGSAIQNTVLAVTFWHIWEARNNAKNNVETLHPRRVVQKIVAYVEMIMQHYGPGNVSRPAERISLPSWVPPPAGVFLINTDAAVFQAERQMGVGVVIRDQHGNCLLAANTRFMGITDPETAEACAIRHALWLAKEEGFHNVIVACDCLSVIQKLNSPGRDRSKIGCLVEDIKKLGVEFISVSFIHVSHCSNVAAHTLARCSEPSVCNVYHNETPDCIREMLLSDAQ
ncbi:hypothetical protein OsI_06384 [Oryza sativa Indica Group]|uniref:Uncharacterized protein n=1 Tax=Oryza sativa subsp. indica TaxID=39946 RepID=B8AE80_ORYSI|nr:hypothetical protein OsI_06384 [Oryza sativa Indica Group]